MTTAQYLPLLIPLLLGLAMLGFSAYRATPEQRWSEICQHLLRDAGIAFVLAPLVAMAFEFYQRSHETLETTQRAFNASMAEQLTPDVWEGVQKQILSKRLLRRNVEIRVKLQRNEGLEPGRAVMSLELAYDLYNLRRTAYKATIEHELDYQFWIPEKQLPRFERVVLENQAGAKEYEGAELRKICTSGIVRLPVQLEPYASSHARITTVRSEIVTIPGSYNLYVTDYTKDVRVTAERLDDIGFEVKIRPEGEAQDLKRIGKATWVSGSLILPGQGIEMKFLDSRSPQR